MVWKYEELESMALSGSLLNKVLSVAPEDMSFESANAIAQVR